MTNDLGAVRPVALGPRSLQPVLKKDKREAREVAAIDPTAWISAQPFASVSEKNQFMWEGPYAPASSSSCSSSAPNGTRR